MSDKQNGNGLPGPLVALMGWLIPGAGYWLIGDFTRGTVVCAAIIVLWFSGLLIAGVRVIEVPGYDSRDGTEIRMIRGQRVPANHPDYERAGWALKTRGGLLSEIANKPWFVGQVLTGPLSLGTAAVAVKLAQRGPEYPRPHSHLETVGTLFTAIAGMLNLLVMIDAAHRAGRPPNRS